MPPPPDPYRVVLDTNVVLDWLVFRDPSASRLGALLRSGRLQWMACTAMRDELEHVLTRADLARWEPDFRHIATTWEAFATPLAAVAATPLALRCTDPDDQKFLDLALQCGAAALLSRDRAVLKLAGRARRLGLAIDTAERWTRSFGG